MESLEFFEVFYLVDLTTPCMILIVIISLPLGILESLIVFSSYQFRLRGYLQTVLKSNYYYYYPNLLLAINHFDVQNNGLSRL